MLSSGAAGPAPRAARRTPSQPATSTASAVKTPCQPSSNGPSCAMIGSKVTLRVGTLHLSLELTAGVGKVPGRERADGHDESGRADAPGAERADDADLQV